MNTYKATWHHLRRSPFQTLTAILVMSTSFFVLSFYAIVSRGLNNVLNYFETKPEITIFLKDGLDKNTVEDIQNELSHFSNIRQIKYVSKEKALEIYKDQNKNNPLLTEMVTANILPASFEVSVSDPQILEQINNDFSKNANVDEIIYQKNLISSLLSWTQNTKKAGLIVISLTITTAFLTIFSIIGMKITNRKDEIRVSRLLGASKYYVKKPFLIEGIFYGLFGSFIGCTLTTCIFLYFKNKINGFFSPVDFVTSKPIFYIYIYGSASIIGIILGYLASWLGVKRYIKY